MKVTLPLIITKSVRFRETPNINDTRLDTTSYNNTDTKTVNAYLVAPELVNKDNYKEILIDSGYYTESQLQ